MAGFFKKDFLSNQCIATFKFIKNMLITYISQQRALMCYNKTFLIERNCLILKLLKMKKIINKRFNYM